MQTVETNKQEAPPFGKDAHIHYILNYDSEYSFCGIKVIPSEVISDTSNEEVDCAECIMKNGY
jgi:hypothetical protein